jgi:hypothetical protein
MPGGDSQASSDAFMTVQHVCRDGIRFRLGLQWRDLASPGKTLVARYLRISAASQPPRRVGGADWQDGIRVRDGTDDGRPFQATSNDWKRQGVFQLEGTPSLDQPEPGTIVLDRWLAVPAVPAEHAAATAFTFTGRPNPRAFLSVPYPQPPIGANGVTEVPVCYADTFDLRWTRPLNAGAFVAISLDRFWPPERDSADYIAHVEDCDLHR